MSETRQIIQLGDGREALLTTEHAIAKRFGLPVLIVDGQAFGVANWPAALAGPGKMIEDWNRALRAILQGREAIKHENQKTV